MYNIFQLILCVPLKITSLFGQCFQATAILKHKVKVIFNLVCISKFCVIKPVTYNIIIHEAVINRIKLLYFFNIYKNCSFSRFGTVIGN